MDVYTARQPIFDRDMRLYGYELLYRKNSDNFYQGIDDDQATISLINNAFLVFNFNKLIDGTRGFINFSQNLLENDLIYMLPKDKVVIEILENVEATDSVIKACEKLKASGYTLALDDFVLNEITLKKYIPFIQLADIIKVEFPAISGNSMQYFINKYKNRVTFLAEKVETRKDFQRARNMGFELFQGYFFSKPVMTSSKEIGAFNVNLLRILEELNREEADFQAIAEIIQMDVDLTYKILRRVNSAYYGPRHKIKSINSALVMLGLKEIRSWVHIMLLRGIKRPENEELVKTSMIRGKTLSLIAKGQADCSESDYFITGLLSSIDVLLNKNMEDAIHDLLLSDEVQEALLGKENKLRHHLDMVLAIEQAQWKTLSANPTRISAEKYMKYYLEALSWQQSLAF